MKLRSKLAAMLGAGVLVLGVAGIAMAAAPGNPWQGNGYPSDSCTPTTTGTMLWIFNNGGTPTDLTINGHLQSGSWEQEGNSSTFHFTTTIDATNYPPTSAFANHTGDAGQLVLSGCNEGSSSSSSSSTSFTSSESGSSTTESSTTESSTTSSSTSFTGSESGETSVPSQPNTATVGDSNSGPSNGAWLLVAALGALIGSVVVLTPARAKNRR
jgi:hypothetical protein